MTCPFQLMNPKQDQCIKWFGKNSKVGFMVSNITIEAVAKALLLIVLNLKLTLQNQLLSF
jgi:hypothetical protein